MSGTTSTSNGTSITNIPVTSSVSNTDTVLGVFGGSVQNAKISDIVSAGIPNDVVTNDVLESAFGSSSLGQYTSAASQSAVNASLSELSAKSAQAASQVNANAANTASSNAATIYSGVQEVQEAINATASSAQNAVSGVASDASAAKVMLTAAINGNSPLNYRGYWNASTNSPALTSGSGSTGDLYVISTAGNTQLNGNSSWQIGDVAFFSNGVWNYSPKSAWPAVAQSLTGLVSVSVADAGGFGIGPSGDYPWAMKDEDGFIRATLTSDGFSFPGSTGEIGEIVFSLENGAPNGGIRTVDEDGFVLSDTTGQYSANQTISSEFSQSEIDYFDADNKAFTASVDRQGFPTGQRPNAEYNLAISCGQSEQNGEMSLPILTQNQPFDNLMIGGSPRCADPNATTSPWQPVGGSWTFNPLMPSAWNQSTNTPILRSSSLLNSVTPSSFTISADGYTITSNDSSVDFTKVFLPTDTIQFSGFTGEASWMNIVASPVGNSGGSTSWAGTSYVAIRSVSTNSIVLWVGGLPGTYSGVTIGLYSAKDPCLGEDQTTCSVNYERAYDWRRSPAQRLVCGNTCVGGQSLANLSKGANPDLYSRNVDLVTGFKNLCGSASAVVYVLPFGQGGSDLNTPYDTYMSQFLAYVSDIRSDIKSITGQSQDPFFEWFIISGGNLPSANNMSVSCAQVDAFRNGLITNGYCVGPGYWSPDYYAHWSSNGERWMGAMRAKIRNLVIYQGRGWMPMHMRSVAWRGKYLLVNLHVPVGKAQFSPVWVGQVYEMVQNYGFNAFDSSGNSLEISSVSLVSDTCIMIELATVPSSAPSVAYADWTNEIYGSGNVCDSDNTEAFDNYTWANNTGQPFTEQNTDLQGKPYPLNNWLCPYYITSEKA